MLCHHTQVVIKTLIFPKKSHNPLELSKFWKGKSLGNLECLVKFVRVHKGSSRPFSAPIKMEVLTSLCGLNKY